MLYPEFGQYEPYLDPRFPIVNAYKDRNGHVFYVEPGFYFQLVGFKEKRWDRYEEILSAIEKVIEENPLVVFTANYENPSIEIEGSIYREIDDVAEANGIYYENKSRGSDYGD